MVTQAVVGRVRITALEDGSSCVPLSAFPGADAARAMELAQSHGVTDPPVTIPVRAFLIEAQSGVYLIDAGTGSGMGPTLGRVAENLAVAGYAPADLKKILMTHLHVDHVGGLMKGESVAYLNAELYLQEDEMSFWRSVPVAASPASRLAAIVALDAYRDRLKPFSAGTRICNEIVAYPLPGHTPGHTGFLIEDSGERMLIWGDIVHASHLQVPMPDWQHAADVDPAQASATRKAILKKAVAEKLRIAGSHVATPGFGIIAEKDGTFAFRPSSSAADKND